MNGDAAIGSTNSFGEHPGKNKRLRELATALRLSLFVQLI